MLVSLNICAAIVMYFLALAESSGEPREKVFAALMFLYNLALAFIGYAYL